MAAGVAPAAAGSAPPSALVGVAAAALLVRSGWHVGRGCREGHHDASAAGSQKSIEGVSASVACRHRQWSRSGSRSGRHVGEGDLDAEAKGEAVAGGDTVTSSAGLEAQDGPGTHEGHTSAGCDGVGRSVAVAVDVEEGVLEGDTSEAGPEVGAITTRPGPPGWLGSPPTATRREVS